MNQTASSIQDDTRLDDTDGEHDRFKHYVLSDDLDRAIIEGTPCVALCGKHWVPQLDLGKYPVCPTCKDIYDQLPD